MSLLIQVYHRLPAPVRSAAATLRGYQLKSWRYGAETDALVAAAHERETWSEARWKTWREERLARLLHRAATRVPHYARLWAERRRAGDRRPYEDLANWPVLTKEALRANPRDFVADDSPIDRMMSINTSGTTGKPLRLWRTRAVSRAWYALVEARMRQWNGVTRHEPWAIFGGQLVAPFAQTKPPYWVYNAALRQLYCSTHHLSGDTVAAYADALRRHKVTHLIMYPSSVNALATFAEERGVALPRIQVAISNAEALTPDQRARIGRAFQCRVANSYGMAELAAAASECTHGTLHAWPDVGLYETLADGSDVATAPGASGRFVLTGLLNQDMPLIRYEVGDRGALDPATPACPCGRSMPALAAIEGRSNDMIVTPDGRQVFWLNPVFYGIPVREAQIVQEDADALRVRYVRTPQMTDEHTRTIRRNLEERVGSMRIVLDEVTAVPRTANGKIQAVVNAWSRRSA